MPSNASLQNPLDECAILAKAAVHQADPLRDDFLKLRCVIHQGSFELPCLKRLCRNSTPPPTTTGQIICLDARRLACAGPELDIVGRWMRHRHVHISFRRHVDLCEAWVSRIIVLRPARVRQKSAARGDDSCERLALRLLDSCSGLPTTASPGAQLPADIAWPVLHLSS